MPCMVRWPGVIKPGTVVNDVVSTRIGRRPWWPRRASLTSRASSWKGFEANGKTFKVHLDGYNQMDPRPRAKVPAREFFYFTDDGDLCGLRVKQWKAVFMEQTTMASMCGVSR